MRILVLSDSHGSLSSIEKAIEQQPDARHIIFLGDGERDIENASYIYNDRSFHIVCGNCDFCSTLPTYKILNLGEKRIFICHGHTYGVKSSYEHLISAATAENADIVLFGHTHIAYTEYRDGLYIMNPGSLSRACQSSYGFIDITDSGTMTVIVR